MFLQTLILSFLRVICLESLDTTKACSLLMTANIVKGERNDSKKRSFLDCHCRAASYIRAANIVKGECNDKQKTQLFRLALPSRILYSRSKNSKIYFYDNPFLNLIDDFRQKCAILLHFSACQCHFCCCRCVRLRSADDTLPRYPAVCFHIDFA